MKLTEMRVPLRKLVAVAVVLALYWATRLPRLPGHERADLASRFLFSGFELPRLPDSADRRIRSVHPGLEHISAWISSVGAAVALMDLDGDGLANEVCHVDPRSDQVIISPVPGRAGAFQPFELAADPLPYETATMAPMGCLPGDFNEDGLLDALVYYWGRTPILFLRAPPGPRKPIESRLSAKRFRPRELVQTQERWFTNAATQADLDGDGRLDLIFGNYFQDGARILDGEAPAKAGSWMQDSMSRAFNGGRNRIFLGIGAAGEEGASLFRPIEGAWSERVAQAWTLAVGAADLDGDLLPEIYFANDFGPDRLLHNRSTPGKPRFAVLEGAKTLTTPNSKVINRDSFKGMGVDFGDLNQDGWLDIYVSNIADEYALQESHFLFMSTGEVAAMKDGAAPYRDESEALGLSRSGWAWETRLGDFDNDGALEALQATGFIQGETDRWPELHELALGNDELLKLPFFWPRFQRGDDLSGQEHVFFFVQDSRGYYFDISADIGLPRPQVTRGIATGDVDGDGDLDMAVANQWQPSFFHRNDSANAGAFLGLRLLLALEPLDSKPRRIQSGHPQPSVRTRAAVGAQAAVTLPDGRRLVAQVDGGNGHSGVRSPELHFGLGPVGDGQTLKVEIAWRDARGRPCSETIELSPGRHTMLLP